MNNQSEPGLNLNSFCQKHWPLLLGLLLIFSAAVSFYGTGLNYFYDIDEPKYARAVYEMVTQGNFFAPMFDGIPRMEKPPLAYWAMYPFAWIASFSDFSGNALFLLRMPTVICSVFMVLGTALMGRKLFGAATGLLAGMMLQSSVLFKFMSVMIKVDVVFACCVTWACFFYLLRYLGDRSEGVAAGGAILTALGVLAKGPFAFLPLAGYVLAVGIRYNVNRKHELGESASFLSSLSPGGLIIAKWNDRKILFLWFLAGCIPFFLWLYAAWINSGFDYSQGLVGQFFHNTSTTGTKALDKLTRLDPYFDTLTVIFFPWGGYVFGTVFGIWRAVKEKFDEKYIFMVCIFIVYLLIFTLLFKLKSNRYMLPVLPILAILVCDWLVNAKRDKAYRTFFEMGFIWLCSMAALLGYRSFKSGNVSVNLADGVAVGQYMEFMIPFFIALACFFVILLVVSIKQYERPALHIIGASLGMVAVMPFYYNALPSYASLTENRPLPVMGQAVADKINEMVDGETLVLHRPFFIKTFPDVVYYLKKLDNGGRCMYSLGSSARPAEVVQALATPYIAADLFKKEYSDAEKYPSYSYFKNTKFKSAVLLLASHDFNEFNKFFESLPPMIRKMIEIEELDVLTVKWVEHRVRIVRFNPRKMK
ncbi:ArnT family glycosyltransferase [Maridesulfovibrio hydrothermalis]|uniref:Glycosyl transferase family 39 n=1 Tax=Maridesulfovibrio hydrothermalis AM13 = DSM 14728 TaxID=1121451 RepID=L0R853_9BACT|nr:glycosyltransferase family 39 protein [Maridesulfovibrio hydrothermalis]CCO22914.1 Glycosyl transferase family 39 [Maridesulfovibrio hydrothermalis AM13 = DSM 14728]